MSTAFLTAQWRHLLMLNWRVPDELLQPYVPAGTVLDHHDGAAWVSVVAFLMLDTRVLGVPVPFHMDFEEINLRLYVRRDVADTKRGVEYRRGVVFVRELVPKTAIAAIARWVYNENYRADEMDHAFVRGGEPVDDMDGLQPGDRLDWTWRAPGGMASVGAKVAGSAKAQDANSHGSFITEHYWGYARQRDGGTVEYEVEHPPWPVHPVADAKLAGAFSSEYGMDLGAILQNPADSAFLAVGGPVSVYAGRRI